MMWRAGSHHRQYGILVCLLQARRDSLLRRLVASSSHLKRSIAAIATAGVSVNTMGQSSPSLPTARLELTPKSSRCYD